MNKYRIIKKTNYRVFRGSSNIYDEAYFVQVKYFLFYRNLHYWTGSDVDRFYYHKTDCLRNRTTWPQPYSETSQKFGRNQIRESTGEYIFFLSLDAAKYFCEILKKQEKYIIENLEARKRKKTKTVEVIDMNDTPEEEEDKKEKVTVEVREEIKKTLQVVEL